MNVSEKLPRNGHIQTIYDYLLGLIKKLDASIGSVRSRMNALTTLANSGGVPAGTIEAEVVDARVDSTGHVYANLGEAVRGQAGNAVSGSGVILNDSRFQNAFGGDFDNLPNNRVYPVHLIFESEQDADAAHAPVTEPGGIIVTFGRGANRAMGDMQMLISTNGTSSTGFVWQGEIWVREYWDVSRNRWNAWHRPATSADIDGSIGTMADFKSYVMGE